MLHELVTYYLIAMNVLAFALYGVDKLKAKRHSWRITERTLLLLAFAGGSLGAWAGMKLWHHKTRHRQFSIGVPLMLALHIASLLYLHLRP